VAFFVDINGTEARRIFSFGFISFVVLFFQHVVGFLGEKSRHSCKA
jgi:hypothetical protein